MLKDFALEFYNVNGGKKVVNTLGNNKERINKLYSLLRAYDIDDHTIIGATTSKRMYELVNNLCMKLDRFYVPPPKKTKQK